MTCPRCRRENPYEARFCEECGAPLTRACAACSSPLSPTAKFCPQCGHPVLDPAETHPTFASPAAYTPQHLAAKILTSRSALEGERKVVTVLFCDIVNSTPLVERLGAEAMHALLNRFFDLALAEVHRYEGTINQFLGDGFMALFGAPVAHEDHARRAVLAALGIQRTVREQATAPGGEATGITVRMGLNTGSVVVGKIGDNLRMDYTAVGDTTNLAARLQQHAEAGAVLMSEATSRLVKGYVRVEGPTSLAVKGKVEPITTFRVVGLGTRRSPLGGRDERALSPFVGRARELAVLQDVLREAEAGSGQLVGIVGEPGVGKSRLLYEFRRSLADRRTTYLEGRCLSYGSAVPYLPLQGIIRDSAGITDGDSPGEIGEKVQAALEQVGMPAEESAPYLLQFLGIKEGTERLAQIGPETIKARIFETLRELTLQGSRRRPLVLVVEDLHWIDRTSEEWFTSVAEALTRVAVLLLTTYRPGYRAPWIDKSYTTQIGLRPLSPDDSLSLVQSALQRADASTPLTRIILAKAEGNPFFLEELTHAVLERTDVDPARAVPDTIQGVLMARIDRLPEQPKRVLQTAAVLGREFSLGLLDAVCRDCGDLGPHLAELKRLEFLYERAGGPEPVHVFKHALTQDVAYESLLTTRRQALHAEAGDALEALYSGRLDEVYEHLAHHYSRSGNRDKALDYLAAANQKASRLDALLDAKAYFDQAMELLDAAPDTPTHQKRRIALLVNQILVMYGLVRQREYYELLTRYERVALQVADDGLLGAFYTCVGWCEFMFGRLDDSIRSEAKAGLRCERGRYIEHAEVSYVIQILARFYRGDFETCLALMDDVRRVDVRSSWFAWSLLFSGWARACRGDWGQALEECDRGRRASEEVSDSNTASAAEWVAEITLMFKGDLAAAQERGLRAVQLASTPIATVWAQGFLIWARSRAGQAAEGIDTVNKIAEMMLVSFLPAGNLFQLILGEAQWLAGENHRARTTLDEALAIAQRCGMKFHVGWAHRLLGEVISRGDSTADGLELAAAQFERAVSTLREIGAENELALAYAGYGRLLRQQGKIAEARDHLARALEVFDRLGTLSEPDRIRGELATLGSG